MLRKTPLISQASNGKEAPTIMKHLRNISLTLFLCYFGIGLLGQVSLNREVDMQFTQDSLLFDAEMGELSNVLKIANRGEQSITVFPVAKLPTQWQLIFALPEKLTLSPGSKKNFLTLDIAVPTNAAGGTHHQIDIALMDEAGQQLGISSFYVYIPIVHSWEARSEATEVFIPAQGKKATFNLFIQNTGNTAEDLGIDFLMHPSLDLYKGPTKKVFLPAGADTTLTYHVRYIPADISVQKLPLRFAVGHDATAQKVKAYVFFILLDNEFDYSNTQHKNFSVELFSGNFGADNEVGLGLRANGQVDIGDDGQLNMDVDVRSLLGGDRSQDRYLLQYRDQQLELEGSHDFLRAEYRTAREEENNWTFGASQYYKSALTQINLSRQQIFNQSRITTGVDYFSDLKDNRQMAMGKFVLDMPYQEKNNIFLSVQNLYINHQGEEKYASNAQQYLFRYEGRHSTQWNSALEINYTTPRFELAEAGLLQAAGNLLYRSPTQKQELALVGNYVSKSTKHFEKGTLLYTPRYQQTQLALDYRFFLGPSMMTTLGTAYHRQQREATAFNTENPQAFQLSRWAWRFETRYQRNFSLSVKKSDTSLNTLTHLDTPSTSEHVDVTNNWEVRSRFRHRFLSVDYHFRSGSELGDKLTDSVSIDLKGHSLQLQIQNRNFYTGLKFHQFEEESRLIVPLMVRGRLFGRSLSYAMASNLIYEMDTRSTSLLARANLDWQFEKGWHLLLKGQLTQNQQGMVKDYSPTSQNLSSNFEMGLRKDMRVDLQKAPTSAIKIRCFKDENGNGLWDKEEMAMPDIRLHLSPVQSASISQRRVTEAAVFSNEKGQADFRHIPNGVYKLTTFRLGAATDSYFSTTAESMQVQLFTDQELLLPFGKGKKIQGQVKLERDDYSALGEIPLKGIRIKATNAAGRTYQALTDKAGKFSLFVPFSETYEVEIQNPFKEQFELNRGKVNISMAIDQDTPKVEFLLKETSVEVDWN